MVKHFNRAWIFKRTKQNNPPISIITISTAVQMLICWMGRLVPLEF